MGNKTSSYVATKEDEGKYVREILRTKFDFSAKLLKSVKFNGDILLNGKHVTVRQMLIEGDVLTVEFPEEESWFAAENIPIDIVYEDDDLLLINKQAGLIVHPTYNFPTGTLANAIVYYMQQKGEEYKLRLINRLDMNTSGIVMVAKNSHAQDIVSRQMQRNETVKEYIAIVHGVLEGEGTIDLPIDRDQNHMARRMVIDTGYPSVTHWKSIRTFKNCGLGQIQGFSILRLKLDTGRTHQIRVHLTHLGHPLVGDELYGQLFGYDVPPTWMNRQALHAAHLELNHPVTGQRIAVDAKLPDDMKKCIGEIEKMEENKIVDIVSKV